VRRALWRRWPAGTVALVLLAAGCSAPVRPELPAEPPATPAAVTIPADGSSLRSLGFSNGPATAFSVPRDVVVSTRVDQPTGVTVVFSQPSATEVAAYLVRTLPKTGFVVTSQATATASLTFTGYGWDGSFTGTGDSSAVILRP
jgi:hypothetical protein